MQSNISDLNKTFEQLTCEYLTLLKEKIDSIDIEKEADTLKKKICEFSNLPDIRRLKPYYNYLSEVIHLFDIEYSVSHTFLKILYATNMLTLSQCTNLFNIIKTKNETKFKSEEANLKKSLKIINNPDLNEYLEDKANSEIGLCIESKSKELFEEIKKMLSKIDWPSIGIDKPTIIGYGASINGFQTQNSDLDLTILTNSFVDERQLLRVIYECYLKDESPIKYKIVLKVAVGMRIPIITIEFNRDKNLKVDISINNILGVINSKLLLAYAKIDSRIQNLGILLKLWKKAKEIEKITSYALILMMINYLQRLDYPLAPSLQNISKVLNKISKKNISIKRILEKGTVYDKNVNVDFETNINEIKKYVPASPKNYNLITLLRGFFEFCLENRNRSGVLSIKHAALLPKFDTDDSLLDTHKQKNIPKTLPKTLFSLEDPFDDAHDPGRLKDDQIEAQEVLKEMEKAFELLDSCSSELELNKLFEPKT